MVASVLVGVLVASLALPFVATLGLAAKVGTDQFDSLPADLRTPPLAQRSTVLDAKGKVLATFYDQNRVQVPLASVAPVMQKTLVAFEDSRFYEHGGVDLRGILRALVRNSSTGSTQGASTLTQQYVKNVRLLSADTDEERQAAIERSTSRKIQEARYAIALEKELTKQQILERYLNIAYFGAGAYGIQAASRRYFSVNASELTLPQAALLTGIVRNPYSYDPLRNPALATKRRAVVLARLVELGTITQAEADAAKAAPLGLKPTRPANGCVSAAYANYFCDYVVQLIENDPAFGRTREERRDRLYQGGLTVRTTIDPKVQAAAQKAVAGKTGVEPENKEVAAAIVMIKPGAGDILAMAINRPYSPDPEKGNQINYAVGSNGRGFQAGSTFKPFVLAAAIKAGIPLSTVINSPIRLDVRKMEFRRCNGQTVGYTGRDYVGSSTGSGALNLWTGTSRSNNTFYLQLEERTGLCEPVRLAQATGIERADGKPLSDAHASFTFGTDETTPLSVANAYATFAARGLYCKPRAIVSVADRAGKVLKRYQPTCNQVLEAKTADAVNAVLKSVIDGPDPKRTAAQLSLGRPAAGKTGTTQNNVALWFSGYTPDLAAAVWVGDPRGNNSLSDHKVHGQRLTAAYGGRVAGPIWKAAMLAALKDVPPSDFVPTQDQFNSTEEIVVPNVSGASVTDAIAVLTDAGLDVGATVPTSSALPAGIVVGTDPGAGNRVPIGSTVALLVSDGTGGQPTPSTEPNPTPTEPTPNPTPTEPTPNPTLTTPPPPAGSPGPSPGVQRARR